MHVPRADWEEVVGGWGCQELRRVERAYASVSFVASGVGGDPHQPLIRIETREEHLGASPVPGPIRGPRTSSVPGRVQAKEASVGRQELEAFELAAGEEVGRRVEGVEAPEEDRLEA